MKGMVVLPRLKGSKNLNKKDSKFSKMPAKIVCQSPDCGKRGKEQVSGNFYNTNSSFMPKYPVCKTCLQKTMNPNDIQSICKILKDMNVAFIKDLWDNACEKSPDNPFGSYMRQINSLPQYKGYTWSESKMETEKPLYGKALNSTPNDTYKYDIEFDITPEMILRWGKKYSKEQYMILEDFYHKMKDSNKIETAQDESYLKKLAVISMKMDIELEDGNYGQAKSLGDLFSKYMADSQFRAMDKTDADKTGGLRNFGMIYAEVESEDFIPPWETYRKIKGIKQDIVDKTIMHIENFTLKLNKIESMTTPPIDTPKLESDEKG